MEHIVIKTDEEAVYILPEDVGAIIREPDIWEIPEGDREILGISPYKGSLVIYYRLGKREDSQCGIILRKRREDGMLYGIAASNAGIEEISEELLEEIQPGVWVKKRD